jgi:hypothetical protein
MSDDEDLYLPSERRIPRRWWIVFGTLGVLLLVVGGFLAILGGKHFPSEGPSEMQAVPTLVPTFTPRPTTVPVVTLSSWPWTDSSAPVGLVEVTLSLPAGARVSHEPPPGFRYWSGDLMPTRRGLGWTGTAATELHWFLFCEPDATWPAAIEVNINTHRQGSGTSQILTLTLERGAPATISSGLE